VTVPNSVWILRGGRTRLQDTAGIRWRVSHKRLILLTDRAWRPFRSPDQPEPDPPCMTIRLCRLVSSRRTQETRCGVRWRPPHLGWGCDARGRCRTAHRDCTSAGVADRRSAQSAAGGAQCGRYSARSKCSLSPAAISMPMTSLICATIPASGWPVVRRDRLFHRGRQCRPSVLPLVIASRS
jgi:hypothetical protein